MIASDFIDLNLSQLKNGLPLKYDLLDSSGQRLAKAGEVVSESLKRKWRDSGIEFATAVIATPKSVTVASTPYSPETRPYDPVLMERLAASFSETADFVLQSAHQLIDGKYSGATQVRLLVEGLQTDIASDVATVLATFAKQTNQELTAKDQQIARRSTQLSIMGLVLAHQLGFSVEDQQSTAQAGIFHDIALMDCVRHGRTQLTNSEYVDHPIDSTWLVESAVGITPKVGIAILQVHEQVDGTGFPRGLSANRIIPIARVLNVVDAYLTLIGRNHPEVFPQARNFHPADALGYLMYHAARGRFDRAVVRALVYTTSLYPVGCRVKLSDDSTAIVLRSSGNTPSKPIVRIESGHENIIDLRKSDLAILQPVTSALDCCMRIRKSNLAEVYWR